MKRYAFAVLTLAAIVAPRARAAGAGAGLVTYRDTGCGCCEGWVAAARAAGYQVELHEMERRARLQRFGLSEATAGCHTTLVRGYVVEGHVPFDVLAKLVRERPHIRGITLPGMPLGVPGMPGSHTGTISIFTLDRSPRVFATV